MEHGLEGIDLYNPIKGKLTQIIDYFVEFYGEEYRKKITERLYNTDYIFADRVTTESRNPLEQYFYVLNRNKVLEFKELVLRKLRVMINFSPDNIKEYFDKIEKWKEGISEKDILPVFELFQHIATDIRTPRDLQFFLSLPGSSQKIYKLLNNLYDIYVKGGFKEAFDYYHSEEKHLAKQDDIEFAIISSELKRRFKRQSECIVLEALTSKLNIITSDKNIAKLIELTPYIVDYIEIDKISSAYREPLLARLTEDLKSLSKLSATKVAGNLNQSEDIFKNKVKQAIESIEDDINKIRDSEFFGLLSAKAGLFDKLDNIYKDYLLGADCIASIQDFMLSKELSKGGFNACVVELKNPNKIKNVCVNNSYLTLDDESIIHEMNHALSSYATFNNGIFTQKTGIRSQVIELFDDDARVLYECFHKYTSLDEVINEYLSQQIVERLRRDDFKIGYLDGSDVLYRAGFPLLETFINENMKDIIDCYFSDDGSILFKRFDKQGLNELADVADDILKISRNAREYIDIIKEIESKVGKNEDMFDIAKISGFDWKPSTKKYLDCFLRAEKAIDKIKRAKEINSVYDSENNMSEGKDD